MASFDELLSQYDKRIADAFLEAIQSIKDQAVIARIAELLERRDIAGAIEALHIDERAFVGVEIALQEAFNAGGLGAISELPSLLDPDGNRVVFRFGVRNLVGESILRELSSTLVRNITEDQRAAIRSALLAGLEAGTNPRTIALDLVGTIDRKTGSRTGGIIGLTSGQEAWQRKYAAQIAYAYSPALRKALDRGLRDKRFDAAIEKAIASGEPIPASTQAKMRVAYRNRSLKYRADNIARTETMRALGSARHEAIRQQIDDGTLNQDDVQKVWHSAGDNRVRHTHRALNGKSVAFEARFESPSGAKLRYPGDPQAPASETNGCRCWCEYRVNYIAAGLRKYKARTS